MDQATATFWLGTVGGWSMAFVMMLIRAYEFYRDRRPKLSLVVSLTSAQEEGNTITLLNASKVPANLWNYSLAWVKPGFFRRHIPLLRRVEHEESPFDFENCNITVEPYAQCSLNFSEGDHFSWGHKMTHDIYLKLWMVGRRSHSPKWLWVTGPARLMKRTRAT